MVIFVISLLATWRITSLLVHEAGPDDLLARFRDWIGVAYDDSSRPYGRNVVASALTCTWCTSVWVGWAVALMTDSATWFLYGLAYSAGAIGIEIWLGRHPNCYLRGWTPLGLLNTVMGCLVDRVLARYIDESTGHTVKWAIRRAADFPPENNYG